MKINVDYSQVGRLGKIDFAVCQLIDGLVRLLSLGYLCTDLPVNAARRAMEIGRAHV